MDLSISEEKENEPEQKEVENDMSRLNKSFIKQDIRKVGQEG